MQTIDLTKSSIVDIANHIKQKQISVLDLTTHLYNSIEKMDEKYGAYLSFEYDKIKIKAAEIQKKIDNGSDNSLLAGIPVGIKDNICTKDTKTTCGSKMLENFVPQYNATVIEKLQNNDMLIAGKLNLDEFAMGSTTETSAFKQSKNPWNTLYSPGGSSGGSAVSIASGSAFCTLGSDTGGSIRLPASFCGLTGLKPTYGSVSRFGLIAHASSLDQIGPMTRNVIDNAALFDMIQGPDSKDSTCITTRQSDHYSKLTRFLDKSCEESMPLQGRIIGIPSEYLGEGIAPLIKQSILDAAKIYESLGAKCEFFSMPLVKYAVPTYYILASAEASSNLSRFDGVKYGTRAKDVNDLVDLYYKTRTENFGDEVARRILLGSFVLSSGYFDAYYQTALKVKGKIKKEFDSAFAKYDAILGPTSPDTAPLLGNSLKDPLKMYLNDIYTVSINLAGIPAMSIPCGFDSNKMPIGMQLIANSFDEDKLFELGAIYQKRTNYEFNVAGNQ